MAKIEWNNSLSVGDAEIDGQHQKWIKIYNDLHDKMVTGKVNTRDGIEALQAMADYARYHFSLEETYMHDNGYPDFIKHRRIHKDFDNHLYDYCRKAEDGEIVLNSEIIGLLKNWLLDHISIEDKKYAHFIENKK